MSTRLIARLVPLLPVLFVLGACGDASTGPENAAAGATGSYALLSFNAVPLPATAFQNSAGRIDFVSGSLVLRADGSFTETLTLRTTYTSGAAPQTRPVTENGTFSVTGSQITFTLPPSGNGAGFSYTGDIAGRVVSYTYDGGMYRFER